MDKMSHALALLAFVCGNLDFAHGNSGLSSTIIRKSFIKFISMVSHFRLLLAHNGYAFRPDILTRQSRAFLQWPIETQLRKIRRFLMRSTLCTVGECCQRNERYSLESRLHCLDWVTPYYYSNVDRVVIFRFCDVSVTILRTFGTTPFSTQMSCRIWSSTKPICWWIRFPTLRSSLLWETTTGVRKVNSLPLLTTRTDRFRKSKLDLMCFLTSRR